MERQYWLPSAYWAASCGAACIGYVFAGWAGVGIAYATSTAIALDIIHDLGREKK